MAQQQSLNRLVLTGGYVGCIKSWMCYRMIYGGEYLSVTFTHAHMVYKYVNSCMNVWRRCRDLGWFFTSLIFALNWTVHIQVYLQGVANCLTWHIIWVLYNSSNRCSLFKEQMIGCVCVVCLLTTCHQIIACVCACVRLASEIRVFWYCLTLLPMSLLGGHVLGA